MDAEQVRIKPIKIKKVFKAKYLEKIKKFYIHNEELKLVEIVGVVTSINNKSNTAEYIIEDETGYVFVHLKEEYNIFYGKELDGDLEIIKNKYVRIIGEVHENFGERILIAHNIRPICDYNEITHHGLSVILEYISTKEYPSKRIKLDTAGTDCDHSELNTSNMAIREKAFKKNPMSTVYKLIDRFSNRVEGVSFGRLQSEIGGEVTSKGLKKILDALLELGAIQHTSEMLHYKTSADTFSFSG